MDHHRPGRNLVTEGLALGAVLGCWMFPVMAHFAGSTGSHGWIELFGDPGVTLFVVEQLHAGQRLYEDVAYPYGPVSIHLQAWLSAVLGNNQRSVALFQGVFGILFGVLLFIALRRGARLGPVLVVLILGMPWIGPVAMPYHPIEACLLAGIAALWVAPEDRSWGRAAAVGGILGLWQWVKFGGAIYAGIALILVDGIVLAAGRARVGRWLRGTLLALVVFVGIESLRIGWAFATLPAPIAWDFVWPAHMTAVYAAFEDRYPVWISGRYFLAQQLLPLIGVFATGAALILAYRDARQGQPLALGPLVPAVFFLVGIGTYVGHVYLYMTYAWCLLTPIPGLLSRAPRAATLVLALVAGPHVWVEARQPFARSANLTLPNGDRIDCPPEYQEAYAALRSAAQPLADRPGAVLILSTGSGFYFQQGLTPPTRHTWLQPHFFRPYDAPEFRSRIPNIRVLALVGLGELPPDFAVAAHLHTVFDPDSAAMLASRIHERLFANSVCQIYRLDEGAVTK